jgi:hypothetical protein
LQKESNEDEDEEAENRSSVMNQLVKHKIVQKQEAKAKAHY